MKLVKPMPPPLPWRSLSFKERIRRRQELHELDRARMLQKGAEDQAAYFLHEREVAREDAAFWRAKYFELINGLLRWENLTEPQRMQLELVKSLGED